MLDLYTVAGIIHSESPNVRSNQATIKTNAGAINGHYTLGEKLSKHSNAGAIDIQVVMDTTHPSPSATFETKANAGLTNVHLLSPLGHRRQLASQHSSIAGSVNVVYPEEWEGVVEGSTMVGSLVMNGNGLRIVDSRGGFINHYQRAVKGDFAGKGSANLTTTTGAVFFSLQ